MKKRILAFLLCVGMILPLMACNHGKDLPLEMQISGDEYSTELETIVSDCVAENPAKPEDVSIAVTDFAVRLFRTEGNTVFYISGGGMNRLISPLSVLTALSMVSNGAKSETKQQIEDAFGISMEELNQYISDYMKNLSQEEGNKLYMANSIWIAKDESFTIQEDFLKINKDYYDAEIREIPFDQDALTEINQWVEDNTDGLIKEIIHEIPEDAMMYLINALVFDARWEETYDVWDIHEGTFTVLDDIEQEVDFMYSEEKLYLEDEYATGFIKYYEGREYAFVALLPKENITLSDYINTLSGESLRNLLENPEEVMVHAWLPQFEVEYNVELSNVLVEMGMKDIFDVEKADLSGIGTSTYGNLRVDRVLHKTYIEVSPVGTKAGAATAVEVLECSSIEPLDAKEVRLNRPFFYMIMDCENNQPIFMGTVNCVNPYRCGIIDDLCSYPLEK